MSSFCVYSLGMQWTPSADKKTYTVVPGTSNATCPNTTVCTHVNFFCSCPAILFHVRLSSTRQVVFIYLNRLFFWTCAAVSLYAGHVSHQNQGRFGSVQGRVLHVIQGMCFSKKYSFFFFFVTAACPQALPPIPQTNLVLESLLLCLEQIVTNVKDTKKYVLVQRGW